MGWLHISGPVLGQQKARDCDEIILRYYTVLTNPMSGFGMDFRLYLKRVTVPELDGYPEQVRTHANVFRRVNSFWGYPDRNSFDEGAFEDTEMYLI